MNTTETKLQPKLTHEKRVLRCGWSIWLLLAVIPFFGEQLQYEIANVDRPIFLITSLFIVASLISLLALRLALKIEKPAQGFLRFVLMFAVGFRVIQLFTPPFQEIDHYRYLWDGIVVTSGNSPYQYSPHEVLQGNPGNDLQLMELRKLAFRSSATATILSRVHYPKVRTLYPPVSQAVFALTAMAIPKESSVSTYLFAIKCAVLLFDLGILFLIAYLLSLLHCNPLWVLAYGWNPLVIKEFSNSGHLDSIAVFFVVLSVVLLVRFIRTVHPTESGFPGCSGIAPEQTSPTKQKSNSRSWIFLSGSSLSLAFGFGAKIYPLVLVPLFLFLIGRASRWRQAALFATIFGFSSFIFIWPMVATIQQNEGNLSEEVSTNEEGLTTFLRHWQINEFAYMLVYQNLKEDNLNSQWDQPWFRFLDERVRQLLVRTMANWTRKDDAVYFLSRALTLGFFGLFYGFLLFQLCRKKHGFGLQLASGCFWVLAIFFCMQPTQNPWYWTWAIPFLPFARNQGWSIYSALLLLYYYRFCLMQYSGPFYFLGFPYSGVGLFDYVLVWLEHLPVFLLVIGCSLYNRFYPAAADSQPDHQPDLGDSLEENRDRMT